ncbi:MAG: hypothetical protein JW909_09760 [Planctomycetes bacterium]|nr:hypothetical protein [Planctomycetota bacterium]
MTSRERIEGLFRGEKGDRVGRADAPWAETIARWKKEGLPAGARGERPAGTEADFASFCDFFDMDVRDVIKIDYSFMLPGRVVEKTPECHTIVDGDGATCQYWLEQSGVPHFVDWTVKTPDDWRKLRDRMAPSRERIFTSIYGAYDTGGYSGDAGPTWEETRKSWEGRPEERYGFVFVRGPFEGAMHQTGAERALMWMIEEPETLKDMFDTHANLAAGMLDLIAAEGMEPDGIFLGDDMGYKNGLLFSPAAYHGLLEPAHRKICEKAHELGLNVMLHSDGDIRELLPVLRGVGIDGIEPMEVHAGLDIREIVEEFGDDYVFMGNIGVDFLAKGGEAMEHEITCKLEAAKRAKGYVFHSDHSVPPAVSWDNYVRAIELLDEHGRY